MASVKSSVHEQIRQLNDARKLVLGDVSFYTNIVQGILPIISPSSLPELRRWGAEFLAEAFATPALPSREKETLSLLVLESLKSMVENADEDAHVLRSVIQTAASIYPLAMRWIVNNSYDTPTWERMLAIKSRILRMWDNASPAIRICCIKFAQRVVLAQTLATNVEHKRDGLDVSLAMVPPNHALLDARSLEAEATGLLDRMLAVLQDGSGDALIVDATLNTLSVLVRTRPATATRILNVVLNFNPLGLANSPMTPKTRVLLKSMEKTTRMLLIHLAKRDPHNPLAPRIQQHVERLMRSRAEILDDAGRKRALAEQQAAPYGDAKRQKLGAGEAIAQLRIPPLPPGQNSLAAIFTLTENPGLRAFSVSQVPVDLAARISVSTLVRVDRRLLESAVSGIRDRLTSLEAASTLSADTAPLGVEAADDGDDEDSYEPDYYAAEDTEQILNKLDSAPGKDAAKAQTASLALGAFKLPPPPTIGTSLAAKVGQGTVSRVFGAMQALDDAAAKKARAGLNRLAASSYDRDSWITVITRLAARSNDTWSEAEDEAMVTSTAVAAASGGSGRLNDTVREALFAYVLEDFRRRIDIAVLWLCEEWYSDRTRASQGAKAAPCYDEWAMRLVDGFLPYLHPQDKVLTRFLGEIPELTGPVLARVKRLCRDPSMVPLALTSLLYLVMMRPPVRELALDTVQDIWTEFEDARPMAAKYLVKWRPGYMESRSAGELGPAPPGDTKVAVATA